MGGERARLAAARGKLALLLQSGQRGFRDIFPDESSLLRLVSAVLGKVSDEWETGRNYLTIENGRASPTRLQKRCFLADCGVSRKTVMQEWCRTRHRLLRQVTRRGVPVIGNPIGSCYDKLAVQGTVSVRVTQHIRLLLFIINKHKDIALCNVIR